LGFAERGHPENIFRAAKSLAAVFTANRPLRPNPDTHQTQTFREQLRTALYNERVEIFLPTTPYFQNR
jgi:hypothetical protein